MKRGTRYGPVRSWKLATALRERAEDLPAPADELPALVAAVAAADLEHVLLNVMRVFL